MQQVERADIERGRHRDPAAALDQAFGEMHAGIAVIEAAVDMGGGDRDQPVGAKSRPISARMRMAMAAAGRPRRRRCRVPLT
ncbi:MAG: hypothetical protein BroJett029_38540 [Alphaproteobacteria bacterium]|nr:MAG: hypothetical protein BroJett029_38540 [Alphaproteobacteria bacterium]